MKEIICLIDFDGTISKTDSTTIMGQIHQPKLTEKLLDQFRKKKIGVREYIQTILENLEIDEETFKTSLQRVMIMDETFKNFDKSNIPYKIVSSGSDKNIIYSLDTIGVKIAKESLYTNELKFNGKQATIKFPHYDEENGVDKSAIIQEYRNRGYLTVFIGDGPSDFKAAGVANYTFVIEGSKLHTLCIENKIPNIAVKNFDDVIVKFNEIYKNNGGAL